MSGENRTASKLALLVGSNPLPNYFAAVVLKPEKVFLLYTPETVEPKEYLRAVLRERRIEVTEKCIDDATDVQKIRDACQGLGIDHLHYSGGTKPMAAHARYARQDRQGALQDHQASYLDERKGLLRFDDGYDIPLNEHKLGLTLDLLLELHGIERVAPAKSDTEGGPTDEDVRAVATKILEDPKQVINIRNQLRPEGKLQGINKAKCAPWKPQEHGFSLSVSAIPGKDWTNNRYELWDNFLNGGWLEVWTANHIRTCLGDWTDQVEVNIRCKRDSPSQTEFEIDVALIRGHRLYVVSCTTDSTKALCKSKLFEVAMRARQMGGDLARSALVCLLEGGDKSGSYVEQLRADIASVWDAPNVPRVFGLADLREWSGLKVERNLYSLSEWLDS